MANEAQISDGEDLVRKHGNHTKIPAFPAFTYRKYGFFVIFLLFWQDYRLAGQKKA